MYVEILVSYRLLFGVDFRHSGDNGMGELGSHGGLPDLDSQLDFTQKVFLGLYETCGIETFANWTGIQTQNFSLICFKLTTLDNNDDDVDDVLHPKGRGLEGFFSLQHFQRKLNCNEINFVALAQKVVKLHPWEPERSTTPEATA